MQNKQHIIDTAIRLFQEKGYAHVSVNEICKAAGISYGTFFNKFKTKGHLLNDYYASIFSATKAFETALFVSSPLEKLIHIITSYVKSHEQAGKELLAQFQILHRQSPDIWEAYMVLLQANDRIHCELIRAAQEQGEILNQSAPEAICQAASTMVYGTYTIWSSSVNDMDLVFTQLYNLETLLNVAPEKRRYSKVIAAK